MEIEFLVESWFFRRGVWHTYPMKPAHRPLAGLLIAPLLCATMPAPAFALRASGLEENAALQDVAQQLDVPTDVIRAHRAGGSSTALGAGLEERSPLRRLATLALGAAAFLGVYTTPPLLAQPAPTTPLPAAVAPAPPRLAITKSPTGAQIKIRGSPGVTYRIETTEAMTGLWNPIGFVTADPSGVAVFTDARLEAGQRFYRAAVLSAAFVTTAEIADAQNVYRVVTTTERDPQGQPVVVMKTTYHIEAGLAVAQVVIAYDVDGRGATVIEKRWDGRDGGFWQEAARTRYQVFQIPDRPQRILMDLKKSVGQALSETGDVVSSYALQRFFEDALDQPRIVLQINPDPTYQSGYFRGPFYLGNLRTGQLIFLGTGSGPLRDTDRHLHLLVQFFDDPLSLSEEEYALLTVQGFAQSSDIVYEFYPIYLDHVFAALTRRPGYEGTNPLGLGSVNQANLILGPIYGKVAPAQKEVIIGRLSQVWDALSPGMKKNFLNIVSHGNPPTAAGTLGALVARYLAEFAAAHPDPADPTRTAELTSIFPAVSRVAEDPELSKTLRAQIVGFVIEQLSTISSFADGQTELLFSVYSWLSNIGDLFLDLTPYATGITQLMDHTLAGISDSSLIVSVMNRFSPYLNETIRQRVEGLADGWLADYDGSALRSGYLLQALNWPLGAELKAAIETTVLARDFTDWPSADPLFTGRFTTMPLWWSVRGMSPGGQNTLFKKLADYFQRHYASSTFFDEGRLADLLWLMKHSTSFETAVSYLVPLLSRWNPRHGDEPPARYQERLTRIETILRNGTLLQDPLGTTFRVPAYLDILDQFSRSDPGWPDRVVLRSPGKTSSDVGDIDAAGTADGGSVTISPDLSPRRFGEVLCHETGHARHGRGFPISLVYHWLAVSTNADYVSDRSRVNVFEYLAEYATTWQDNSRAWLTRAIQQYMPTRPSMLNMFLAIWNISKPVDTPPGRLPLFTLQDTGLLAREWIPAGWTLGDMKDGTFTFTFDGRVYTVIYQGYKISNVTSVPAGLEEPVTVLTADGRNPFPAPAKGEVLTVMDPLTVLYTTDAVGAEVVGMLQRAGPATRGIGSLAIKPLAAAQASGAVFPAYALIVKGADEQLEGERALRQQYRVAIVDVTPEMTLAQVIQQALPQWRPDQRPVGQVVRVEFRAGALGLWTQA